MASKFRGLRNLMGLRRNCSAAETAKRAALDAEKKGVESARKVKNEFAAAADNASEKTKGAVSGVAGKLKGTAEQALGSTKAATQVIKDTVAGKAEATTEATRNAVKKEAGNIERCMNTKN